MTVYNASTVTSTSPSPPVSKTLWTYTGCIRIDNIFGVVTTDIQDVAMTCKLSIVSDALAAFDVCTATSIRNFPAGTLLGITGTVAALVCTTGVGASAPGQSIPVTATCVTSGLITVTFVGAATGAIKWYMNWKPLSQGATVA